jgi:hypothetical protein
MSLISKSARVLANHSPKRRYVSPSLPARRRLRFSPGLQLGESEVVGAAGRLEKTIREE